MPRIEAGGDNAGAIRGQPTIVVVQGMCERLDTQLRCHVNRPTRLVPWEELCVLIIDPHGLGREGQLRLGINIKTER
jgi:hypothetical protein